MRPCGPVRRSYSSTPKEITKKETMEMLADNSSLTIDVYKEEQFLNVYDGPLAKLRTIVRKSATSVDIAHSYTYYKEGYKSIVIKCDDIDEVYVIRV